MGNQRHCQQNKLDKPDKRDRRDRRDKPMHGAARKRYFIKKSKKMLFLR